MALKNKKEQENHIEQSQQDNPFGKELLNAFLNKAKLDSIKQTADKSPEEIARLIKVLLEKDE